MEITFVVRPNGMIMQCQRYEKELETVSLLFDTRNSESNRALTMCMNILNTCMQVAPIPARTKISVEMNIEKKKNAVVRVEGIVRTCVPPCSANRHFLFIDHIHTHNTLVVRTTHEIIEYAG